MEPGEAEQRGVKVSLIFLIKKQRSTDAAFFFS